MARARAKARAQGTLIVDTGVLIGIARDDRPAVVALKDARRRHAEVVVVPGSVAEATRGSGPQDARINMVLAAIDVIPPVTEAVARLAGALLGHAKLDATLDALLVAEAVGRAPAVIITTDPNDMRRLAAEHPDVVVRAI